MIPEASEIALKLGFLSDSLKKLLPLQDGQVPELATYEYKLSEEEEKKVNEFTNTEHALDWSTIFDDREAHF